MLRRRPADELLERVWKRYRVGKLRAFQDHAPGTEFIARLTPQREAWAIRHGYIEELGLVDMSLATVPKTLPSGWDAEIPRERGVERGSGERRLSTLEREEVTSGVH